jgi:apolipoprotein N-acyltransferase
LLVAAAFAPPSLVPAIAISFRLLFPHLFKNKKRARETTLFLFVYAYGITE